MPPGGISSSIDSRLLTPPTANLNQLFGSNQQQQQQRYERQSQHLAESLAKNLGVTNARRSRALNAENYRNGIDTNVID